MTSTFMDFAYAAHAVVELILGALKLRGRYAHEAPGSRSGKSKMYVRHHGASLLAHALLGALVLHAGLVDTRVGQGASLVLATFHGGAVGAVLRADDVRGRGPRAVRLRRRVPGGAGLRAARVLNRATAL